jgi:hypothetical protein
LTISRTKGDIPISYLDLVGEFISKYAFKGGVSTEIGARARQFHLQGQFTMRFPKDPRSCHILSKKIKSIFPVNSGFDTRVLVKGLGDHQTFIAMLGYITKDQGQAHYQIRIHNVELLLLLLLCLLN